MNPRLLVACPVTETVAKRARDEFAAVLSQDRPLTVAEVLAALRKHPAEALLFTTTITLDAGAVAALPARIKILATSSVGFDHIDRTAAAMRGIVVTHTPGVLTDATAEHTLLLMLGACRRAAEYGAIMRDGWGRMFGLDEMLGIQASGKRLGIFGFGRIGQAVAARARAFGMKILYHDMQRAAPAIEQGASYFARLEDMLPQCQVLSLHAPGGSETESILNHKTIALLPRGAIVVNTARGTLIDEDALIEALRSGHLAAVGLDVYRNEPSVDKRFAQIPTAFLTPHMGSATIETRDAMGLCALDNIAAVLASKPALNPVPA